MKTSLIIALAIALMIIPMVGCTPQASCPKIGDKAPDFSLPGIDGNKVSLSNFPGKPVIINTWSVNCIECKKEMGYFQEICNLCYPKGLVFLSVNTLDSIATAKEYLDKNGYKFTLLFDHKSLIYKTYCCPKSADPNTFFIGTDGAIKAIKIGGFASKEDLLTEVKKIVDLP